MCVCVCVCVCPSGGTGEVIVVDKDLKWSRWRTRQNCEQLSLFVRVSRSLTCSLPALCQLLTTVNVISSDCFDCLFHPPSICFLWLSYIICME